MTFTEVVQAVRDAREATERLTQEVAKSRAQWEEDNKALLIALNVMQEVVRETETALQQMAQDAYDALSELSKKAFANEQNP